MYEHVLRIAYCVLRINAIRIATLRMPGSLFVCCMLYVVWYFWSYVLRGYLVVASMLNVQQIRTHAARVTYILYIYMHT
jgi:hypothetical protein